MNWKKDQIVSQVPFQLKDLNPIRAMALMEAFKTVLLDLPISIYVVLMHMLLLLNMKRHESDEELEK